MLLQQRSPGGDGIRGDSIPGEHTVEVLQMKSKRNLISDITFDTPPVANPTDSLAHRAQVRVAHGFQAQLIVKSCFPCVERKTAQIFC